MRCGNVDTVESSMNDHAHSKNSGADHLDDGDYLEGSRVSKSDRRMGTNDSPHLNGCIYETLLNKKSNSARRSTGSSLSLGFTRTSVYKERSAPITPRCRNGPYGNNERRRSSKGMKGDIFLGGCRLSSDTRWPITTPEYTPCGVMIDTVAVSGNTKTPTTPVGFSLPRTSPANRGRGQTSTVEVIGNNESPVNDIAEVNGCDVGSRMALRGSIVKPSKGDFPVSDMTPTRPHVSCEEGVNGDQVMPANQLGPPIVNQSGSEGDNLDIAHGYDDMAYNPTEYMHTIPKGGIARSGNRSACTGDSSIPMRLRNLQVRVDKDRSGIDFGSMIAKKLDGADRSVKSAAAVGADAVVDGIGTFRNANVTATETRAVPDRSSGTGTVEVSGTEETANVRSKPLARRVSKLCTGPVEIIPVIDEGNSANRSSVVSERRPSVKVDKVEGGNDGGCSTTSIVVRMNSASEGVNDDTRIYLDDVESLKQAIKKLEPSTKERLGCQSPTSIPVPEKKYTGIFRSSPIDAAVRYSPMLPSHSPIPPMPKHRATGKRRLDNLPLSNNPRLSPLTVDKALAISKYPHKDYIAIRRSSVGRRSHRESQKHRVSELKEKFDKKSGNSNVVVKVHKGTVRKLVDQFQNNLIGKESKTKKLIKSFERSENDLPENAKPEENVKPQVKGNVKALAALFEQKKPENKP